MIVGGQTEARAQLSSTIIDYHAPFDQGLTKAMVEKKIGDWRLTIQNVHRYDRESKGLVISEG